MIKKESCEQAFSSQQYQANILHAQKVDDLNLDELDESSPKMKKRAEDSVNSSSSEEQKSKDSIDSDCVADESPATAVDDSHKPITPQFLNSKHNERKNPPKVLLSEPIVYMKRQTSLAVEILATQAR